MSVDTFTREQFEAALPAHKDTGEPLWQYGGLDRNEHIYHIPVTGTNKRITIRSSVKGNGVSAGTGEDSIRLWVSYYYKKAGEWFALGKLDAWTTRVPGWQHRMTEKLRKLYRLALEDSNGRRTSGVNDGTSKNVNGPKPTPSLAPEEAGAAKLRPADETLSALPAPASQEETRAAGPEPKHDSVAAPASQGTEDGPSATSSCGTPSDQSRPSSVPSFLDKSKPADSQSPACPKCGQEMVVRHRRSDGAKFWGCPGFPNCRGTRPRFEAVTETAKPFTPSHYQEAIFSFIETGTGHGVVSARAGSGKTTTNIIGLAYTDENDSVALVAFNRRIAREQARRAPDHVRACTLHSLGFANIRAAWPEMDKDCVDNRKVWAIIFGLRDRTRSLEFAEVLDSDGAVVVKLVSLCKATMKAPTIANLDWIASRYNVNTNGNERYVYVAARLAFYASVAQRNVIDYDDMIYFCASGIVACEKFDFLFVDETQDLNEAQVRFALLSISEGGRILACGDEFQSIYGWRGASVDAMPNLIEKLNATVMPLSTSYRCCKAVVRLVNREFPQIDFEAAPNAIEGGVSDITEATMLDRLQPGDLVLCRTNAPLVEPAFELIRRGVKVVILGRDIGKGLLVLIAKVQKRRRVPGLLDLLEELTKYKRKEVGKLIVAGKAGRAATLRDQVETIVALADGADTVRALQRRIERVFSDDSEGVVFSSVHKAKGGEADRVFILRPDLMPHKLASAAWELQQEENIRYVAYTRAKKNLYFVR